MRPARAILALAMLAALGACDGLPGFGGGETERIFPKPDRPVSGLGASQFSTEDARDEQVNRARQLRKVGGRCGGAELLADVDIPSS